MKNPVHVLDVLPPGKKKSVDAADLRLQQAYAAFSNGNPSREDCAIILMDLALYSGYYNTTAPDMPAEQVKHSEGMRSVYGRIVRYANMPFDEINEAQRKVIELELQTGDMF